MKSVYGLYMFRKVLWKVLNLMGFEKKKEDDLFILNETNGDVNVN